MNSNWLDKYLYVFKTQIIRCFTYRYDVYGNIIMQAIIMVTAAFFWRALYGDDTPIKGVNVDSMLTYTVMSSIISVLFITGVERRIQNSVKLGSIATDMMKPLNVFGIFLAEDLGSVVALIFQNMIPIILLGSLLIKVPKINDLKNLPVFILSIIFSFFINWLIAALFGMWSFTALDVDALIQIKKHLLRLLSGSIIPMWFFPEWFRSILEFMPFVYIYQLPLDIYIGRSGMQEIYKMLGIQFVWLVILLLLFVYIEKNVTKRLMVQGG